MLFKRKLKQIYAVPSAHRFKDEYGDTKTISSTELFADYEEVLPSEPAAAPIKHQLFYIVVIVTQYSNGSTEVYRATNPAVKGVFYSHQLAKDAADSEHAANGMNYQVVEVEVDL